MFCYSSLRILLLTSWGGGLLFFVLGFFEVLVFLLLSSSSFFFHFLLLLFYSGTILKLYYLDNYPIYCVHYTKVTWAYLFCQDCLCTALSASYIPCCPRIPEYLW